MMWQMFRILMNRISAGAWRSRKQFAWFICLIAGAFLLFVQFLPTPTAKYKDEHPRPRSLNSYGKSKDMEEIVIFNNVHQRVHFIDNDYMQHKNNLESNVYKDAPQNQDENALYREDADTVGKSEAQSLLEQRIKMQQQALPPVYKIPDPITQQPSNDMYNVDNPWTGGNLKYNNFGEPRYDHKSRKNYIPKQRIIHFDLKGAPPKPSILIKLIPWLAKYGATGILLEYEDMFPWDGTLSSLAAKNHYTKKEVRKILAACDENNMEVIPLVQTFGHLEYALKGRLFSYLREIPSLPQAICPSKNDSSLLIRAMIDQIMRLHPNVKYLHIGCDEVFQMGDCDLCRQKNRDELFLKQVSDTAKYVINAYHVKVIIWHDMLTHISTSTMNDFHFGELVEPMVWVYAEDIYRFVQPSQWNKFAEIFPNIWGASAFKGAFGERATVPNVRRHLDNNMNWLDVISTENSKFSGEFRGIVITGWQRFDHFAVLCETLPVAMPSLALNLIAISHGFFNSTIEAELQEALKCVQASEYQNSLDLDSDPFLWEKFSWCFFPGSQAFKLTGRIEDMKREVKSYLDKVKNSRGWITDYNIRHNFSSPMRVDEDLEELPLKLQMLEMLVKSAKEALSEWFDGWTVGEWIEQQLWPLINELNVLQERAESMKLVKVWPVRPHNLLPQLAKYEITEPPFRKSTRKKHDRVRSPADYEVKRLQYIP